MTRILARTGIAAAILVAILVLFGVGLLTYETVSGLTTVNNDLEFTNELTIPPLLEPEMVGDKKVFKFTLQEGETEFLPGQMTRTWGANGAYLMPTIRASEDDDIELHVRNDLDEMTTIHWHGMHLPPTMDGVHQIITPGETWQPYWQVRQQAATLWYHPHLHGVTGLHVYNGLAGMFILEDDNSRSLDIPQEYGVNDFPIIVQDRLFDANGQFVYSKLETDLLGHKGMLGDTLLVNGTRDPYLEVPSGLVRLRLLNGSNARRYNFGFADDREFHQIASDGGFLEQAVATTRLLLSPGERAEILVNFNDTEPVALMSYVVDDWPVYLAAGFRIARTIRDERQMFNVLELRPQGGAAEHTAIPSRLNTIARYNEAEAVTTRSFELEEDNTINGVPMRIKHINEVVRLNTKEIWEIDNGSDTYHPFHVHDVQFQILDRDGVAPPPHEQGWKDTVTIPAEGTVRIMMEFTDYADPHVPYMYHCHILEHEDHGMMGQFVVVADDSVVPEVRTEAAELNLMEHTH